MHKNGHPIDLRREFNVMVERYGDPQQEPAGQDEQVVLRELSGLVFHKGTRFEVKVVAVFFRERGAVQSITYLNAAPPDGVEIDEFAERHRVWRTTDSGG